MGDGHPPVVVNLLSTCLFPPRHVLFWLRFPEGRHLVITFDAAAGNHGTSQRDDGGRTAGRKLHAVHPLY